MKRFVLAALLALASHALLPYLHALAAGCDTHAVACGAEGSQAPSHSPDCPVCGAIAQAGARTLDAPSALAAPEATQSLRAAPPESLVAAPHVELDVARARAPPAPRSA